MQAKELTDLEVGKPVTIFGRRVFEKFNAEGFRGCVKMTDEKAGWCVQLYISRIYMPCFWFRQEFLRPDPEFMAFSAATPEQIETALGSRASGGIFDTLICRGCLRSWMLGKARVAPGHFLEGLIKGMLFKELYQIYLDGDGGFFKSWLDANDTRPRRPRITESNKISEDIIGVKRVKMR